MFAKRLAAFVAAFCLVCCAGLALVGCGSSQSPSDVVKAEFDAVQGKDPATLATLMIGEDATEDDLLTKLGVTDTSTQSMKDFYILLLTKVCDYDYAVDNETIDGDNATVDVTFTTYDFVNGFKDGYTSGYDAAMALAKKGTYDSDKLMDAMFSEINKSIEALDSKDVTKTTTVKLAKEDGKWVMQNLDNDAADAMFGGLLTSLENITSVG